MKRVILSLLLLVFVLGLSSCSAFGIRIDEEHFPDAILMKTIRQFDINNNGYLSEKELEEVKTLSVSSLCFDLSGIEYLTSLEKISMHGNVFSETFVFDYDTSFTDIEFWDCVFENGILFKNDSVENVKFGYAGYGECGVKGDVIFEDCDGLINFGAEFRTLEDQSYSIDLSGCDKLNWVSVVDEQVVTSVDLSDCSNLRSFVLYDYYYNYDYDENDDTPELSLNICGCPNIEEAIIKSPRLRKLVISDCPHLISASEQIPQEERFHSFKYESKDGTIITENEQLVFILSENPN